MSCNATVAASSVPCVPQPPTDNGSCAEMASQCQLWVTQSLFQNEYCVLASFCYAWSNTDVLLLHEYPSYVPQIPTSAQEARLSEEVFYNMTGGAAVMSEQNVIDAYYAGLVLCRIDSVSLITFHSNRRVPGLLWVDHLAPRHLRKPIMMGPTLHRKLPWGFRRTFLWSEFGPKRRIHSDFWGIISAWTGFCDTRAIPYDNLVNYLSYAASSSYHPTC